MSIVTETSCGLLLQARQVMAHRFELVASSLGWSGPAGALLPGRMLCTRMAACLAGGADSPAPASTLARACAAVEMVTAAWRGHVHLPDRGPGCGGSPVRRWGAEASGAVLAGDLMLCEAVELVAGIERGRRLPAFLSKVREVIAVEAEAKVVLRGRPVGEGTRLRLARGRAGLFAFVGALCGGADAAAAVAAERAGHIVGTACLLADDVAGMDNVRGREGIRCATACLCRSAIESLAAWPGMQAGLRRFIESEPQPVFVGPWGGGP